MCQFFSFLSDGQGKLYYFSPAKRHACLSGKLGYNPDSHTSIADFYGFKGAEEDKLNKWEYRPLDQHLALDYLGAKKDDRQIFLPKLKRIMWSKLVPELIIKPIVRPFDIPPPKITNTHLTLLKKWASVEASVEASVRASVWASVEASVKASMWASVKASMGDSSVWDSMGDSVWESVEAYIGSFFRLPQWKDITHKQGIYPFQVAVNLWEKGIVPSWDGKIWRLHVGPEAQIAWKGQIE